MNKIKHICAFSFRDDVEPAARERMLSEIQTFPDKFPAMKNWVFNRNISKRDDRFTHAFIVEFESEADLISYLGSERHETFVKEQFRPLIKERGIITLEAGGPQQP